MLEALYPSENRKKKMVIRDFSKKRFHTIYQKEPTARTYFRKQFDAVQSVRKWELERLGCIEHKYKVGALGLATVELYLSFFFHIFNKITS